jgi:hypothetical protein
MINSNGAFMVPSLWLEVGENGLPANNLEKSHSK